MSLDATSLTTSREYIAVRPTTDPLDPAQVETALRTLHGQGANAIPTIEMLLVTAGADDGVTYLFDGDAIDTARLERTLRRCVPPSYECTRRTTSIADLLMAESPPDTIADTDTDVPALMDRPIAGLELRAREDRRGDWQTQLRPFETFRTEERASWPLTDVVDALGAVDCPLLLQTLLTPKPDWTYEANQTIEDLHWPQPSLLGELIGDLFGPIDSGQFERRQREELSPPTRQRIAELEAVDTRQSFTVNVRALAVGTDSTPPATALDGLGEPFTEVSNTTYQLTTTRYAADTADAHALATAIADRQD
ncbi:hypothetical protein HUG10_07660 [Halorarum halophilum]|uniref:Uncharacterized protein n=1 Tax=Halorarum halophilum TaxID=2743090 RepID=A0A7D5GHC5_9EURY|nr:hypothetical protein [Halobaculum halophilum]QLG27431.1 hypothetical protein HUG10_07660 [Halobaculum halophilum]